MGLGATAHGWCTAQAITGRWLHAHGRHINLALQTAELAQAGARGGGTQTIPVVVHVVWETAAENVSDATILAIIDQLNSDYQALNADYGNVRTPFADSRANAHINFCLATLDPAGNPTTGITRTHTTKAWFNPDTDTDDMKLAPDGSPAWNPLKYLNIWICDISSGATGNTATAGYAYLPYGGLAGTPLDGVVLDNALGTGPGDRTATHEVGHYLGLSHPWGEGNCDPGDGLGDTPATDSPTFSCSNHNLMKCGTLTQYENFMDYSNCSMMFTISQAAVMSGILNGVRSTLLSSTACNTPAGYCIPTSANGPSSGDFINGVELGAISNTGSGSNTGPAYVDYTAVQTTDLAQGGTYTMAITGGEYPEDNFAAWIDYNGDHAFSEEEKLGEFGASASGETQDITFTVPLAASVGATVMRVRGVFLDENEPAPSDPCFNYTFGETEDYGIQITMANSIQELPGGAIILQNFPDHVQVSWPSMASGGIALVIDATGRIVNMLHAEGSGLVIPKARLAGGMYQLSVELQGVRHSTRFVVATP